MAKALVIGSVAIDSVETPHGKHDRILGGSASYASVSASYFTGVELVGVVGQDFAQEHIDKLKNRGIDLTGLEIAEGKTFFWKGKYTPDMNSAITHITELNVFGEFQPKLTEEQQNAEFVFLANIHPALQLDVLNQVKNPKVVALDTMNLWIETAKETLTEVIKKCNILLVNDGEARLYCDKVNLIECGKDLLNLGVDTVLIKKGEHGAMMFRKDRIVFFPAIPLEKVKDPTGAGDTFAGGMVGYLAKMEEVTEENLIRAVQVGTCMASFVVEEYSLNRTIAIKPGELKARTDQVTRMVAYPALDPETLLDANG